MLTWVFSFKLCTSFPARQHSQPSTSPCVWATRTFGCPSRRARSVNRKSHHLLPRRFLPSNRSGKRQALFKCQTEHLIILKSLHTNFMSDLLLIVSVNCRLFLAFNIFILFEIFLQLLLIQALRPDRLQSAMAAFASQALGKCFKICFSLTPWDPQVYRCLPSPCCRI